ncbi:hypothetical protein ScPMuIL_004721 [Solemya velum]
MNYRFLPLLLLLKATLHIPLLNTDRQLRLENLIKGEGYHKLVHHSPLQLWQNREAHEWSGGFQHDTTSKVVLAELPFLPGVQFFPKYIISHDLAGHSTRARTRLQAMVDKVLIPIDEVDA